ncbi:MAG: primosomal protein N' [Deltaproteobacteria bacterium]|nr:primosomal protein N' [Deltaproteobacteria bacterium]
MPELYSDIAVELPVDGTFTYAVPQELIASARAGARVLVPFGKRIVTGYILALYSSASAPIASKIRHIIDVLDHGQVFDENRLKFYKWLSAYYFAPLGEALSLGSPPAGNVKGKRRLSLTASGEAAIGERFDALERRLLEAAQSGQSAEAVAKSLKRKPVWATIERLETAGLISLNPALSGMVKEKTEWFVSMPPDVETHQAPPRKTSPIHKVRAYLAEKGETSLSTASRDMGVTVPMIKRLAQKGVVTITNKRVYRRPVDAITPKPMDFAPNDEQKKAIDGIIAAFRGNAFAPMLLHGVTGGGKTLVYLAAIEEVIKTGKRAIFLTPEIALTSWPTAYLAWRFPGRVAMLHSGLSAGERADEWERISRGEADIVVGARSALFAPMDNLGMIIVDEEHEASYKQEEGVRYHARDSALMLGKLLGITVVLGSATPSVESYYNALTGKYKLLKIENRAGGALPKVDIVDMRGQGKTVISDKLAALIASTLDAGLQSLLLLNRRGFSRSIICNDCGHSFTCVNCSVSLTAHKRPIALKCHYCGFSIPIPDECPECKGTRLAEPGAGTERLEDEARRLFPRARIGRMDSDTTTRKGAARRIIEAVETRQIDILVGTQMVSKGHHFPEVALAGIITADASLNIPDFRSAERAMQLITQAAGRAGRASNAGEVVIQTLNPGHYCLEATLNHDYAGFYAKEINEREDLDYPPFTRLCALRLEGAKEGEVAVAAASMRRTADKLLGNDGAITILGPAPALVYKLSGRFRQRLLLKCPSSKAKNLHAFVRGLKAAFNRTNAAGVNLVIDMDPVTTV